MHRLFFLFIALSTPIRAQDVDWRYYAADASSTKYAPLAQIHRDNFSELQIAWRYTPPDWRIAMNMRLRYDNNRGTPLVVDGVLYYGSPFAILCAVDAGEELWTFDPEVWRERGAFLGNLRGIAYWSDGERRRIFFGTASDRLYSVDAETGKLDPAFGI